MQADDEVTGSSSWHGGHKMTAEEGAAIGAQIAEALTWRTRQTERHLRFEGRTKTGKYYSGEATFDLSGGPVNLVELVITSAEGIDSTVMRHISPTKLLHLEASKALRELGGDE